MTVDSELMQRVRHDLEWAIASPPLLDGDHDPLCDWPSAAFFAQAWKQHAEPPLSLADVAALTPMRLGHYFEWLWHIWLRAHPRYDLLRANAVWREQGITLGETDLLLRDRDSGEIEHWELAVKFYLGYGDLALRSHWHGPQFRDRLDHKFEHLKFSQTRLSLLPAVQQQLKQQNLRVSRVRCVVKGRLFLPWTAYWQQQPVAFAAPQFLHGFWLSLSEWQIQQHRYPHIRRLSREQFLAPLTTGALCDDDVVSTVATQQRPIALALCQHDGSEMHRGFVVPDSWPQQALLHSAENTPQIQHAEAHNQ